MKGPVTAQITCPFQGNAPRPGPGVTEREGVWRGFCRNVRQTRCGPLVTLRGNTAVYRPGFAFR